MDSCPMLVWNVRGLNSAARRGVVRRLVQQFNVSFVCFQESKLSDVSAEIVREC